MGIAIRAKWEPIRELGFASIGAPYSSLGTSLDHPARMLIFQNSMDVPAIISFNGVDDNLRLIEQAYFVFDLTSNKTVPQGFYQAEGDQVFVKHDGVPPSRGKVSLSVVYGAEY